MVGCTLSISTPYLTSFIPVCPAISNFLSTTFSTIHTFVMILMTRNEYL